MAADVDLLLFIGSFAIGGWLRVRSGVEGALWEGELHFNFPFVSWEIKGARGFGVLSDWVECKLWLHLHEQKFDFQSLGL